MPPPAPPAPAPIQNIYAGPTNAQVAAQCAATITAGIAARLYGADGWQNTLAGLNAFYYKQIKDNILPG
jgi:hypothetical protein